MARTSAVSSTVNPPKYRNCTMEAWPRRELLEVIEGLVQGEHIDIRFGCHVTSLVKREGITIALPFARVSRPGVIDQDSAHYSSGGAEEMGAELRIDQRDEALQCLAIGRFSTAAARP
jgi:hypothetical protein